jgi:hypothetical protein
VHLSRATRNTAAGQYTERFLDRERPRVVLSPHNSVADLYDTAAVQVPAAQGARSTTQIPDLEGGEWVDVSMLRYAWRRRLCHDMPSC